MGVEKVCKQYVLLRSKLKSNLVFPCMQTTKSDQHTSNMYKRMFKIRFLLIIWRCYRVRGRHSTMKNKECIFLRRLISQTLVKNIKNDFNFDLSDLTQEWCVCCHVLIYRIYALLQIVYKHLFFLIYLILNGFLRMDGMFIVHVIHLKIPKNGNVNKLNSGRKLGQPNKDHSYHISSREL